MKKNNKPLPERIVANWPAKALSLAAAIMLFLFHNFSTLSERRLSVDLEARFSDGLTAAQQYPRRVWITVRGPEQSVSGAQAGDIEAIADFTRFDTEGVHKAPILIRKKGSLESVDPLEVHVEPLELSLLLERKVRKVVDVVPSFKGFPVAGYGLDQYNLTPPRIEVEGPRSRIGAVVSASTEEIDLSDKRENFTVRVKLKRESPLVSFPDGDSVEFRGLVAETQVQKTYENAVLDVLNLRPDLRLDDPLPLGTVRVQGGQAFLEQLRPELIRLFVDCSGITVPGVYTLPMRAETPPGVQVVRLDPVQVTLDIRPRGR